MELSRTGFKTRLTAGHDTMSSVFGVCRAWRANQRGDRHTDELASCVPGVYIRKELSAYNN